MSNIQFPHNTFAYNNAYQRLFHKFEVVMDREPRELLRAILNPRIKNFVDWKKFLASPEFTQIGKDEIEHFIKYGDYRYIKLILDQFLGHKSFKPMLLWFCDSAGLDHLFTGAELVLKRAASTRTSEGDLRDYMAKYNGTAKDMGRVVPSPPRKPTRQQELARKFNPDGHRGGSPFVQAGAPGLGKRS